MAASGKRNFTDRFPETNSTRSRSHPDPKETQTRSESGRSTHLTVNAVANDVVVVPVFPAAPPNQAKNGAGKIIRTLDQTSRQQAPLQGAR
jgi:hypothetical protein